MRSVTSDSAFHLSKSKLRLGTSSFSSKDWVGPFYPERTQPADYLRRYAEHFDTVEVDATYYAIPSRSTVDGWKDKTPDGFLVSAKFPRSIVHAGEGSKPDPVVILDPEKTYGERDKFLSVMSGLHERLGPLILQFPYFRKEDFDSPDRFLEKLDRFLSDLPKEYRYGVEVRNRTWVNATLTGLLRRHQTALVLVDHAWMPHGDEIAANIDPITSNFSYIRLIGDRKEIEAVTTTWKREVIDRTERLQRWARLIAELDRHADTIYVYVNNHYAGHAPATVRRLQQYVNQVF
jgi:uncharacterized protein YecE (DUF72 family)